MLFDRYRTLVTLLVRNHGSMAERQLHFDVYSPKFKLCGFQSF